MDQINMDQLAEMVVQRIMAANKTGDNDQEWTKNVVGKTNNARGNVARYSYNR
jgi:hypothetical protein